MSHDHPQRSPHLRLVDGQGGGTNSRPSPESRTSGLDTVRFRWRGDRDTYEAARHRPEGVREGPRGEVGDWKKGAPRWGVFPDGLAYLECRATQLVDAMESHALVEPDRLLLAEQVAREYVESEGVPLAGAVATLGRADLASELTFPDGHEGLAFLYGLASINVPWGKVGVEGRKGTAIETVVVRHVRGKSIQLRGYDKGVESGTAGPGERIRVERQRRFRKRDELAVEAFIAEDLAAIYLGSLGRFLDVGEVVVADVVGAIARLSELQAADTITGAERDRLAGFLLYGGDRTDYGRSTWYDRQAHLRRLGIAVDPSVVGRLTVDVGGYLEACAAPWRQAA